MALIGQIAIAMVTDTKRFVSGLSGARASLAAFEKAAHKDITGGSRLVSQGFSNILSGAAMLGPALSSLMSDSAKSFYSGIIKEGLAPVGAYLKDWAANMVFVYGRFAGDLFSPVARAFSFAGGALRAAFPQANLAAIGVALGTMGKGAFQVAAGVGKMAYGFAKLGLAGVAKGLLMARDAFAGLVGVTRQAVNHLGMFAAIAGGVAAYGFYKLVSGGAALAEQMDRARITFGAAGGEIIAAADQMAVAFGTSKRQFIQTASAMGQIFQGAGYDEKAAAGLSIHFVKLATDLAAFAHIPMEDAMHKIQSGLVGMARPLREVGVLMSDEAVKAYAAAHGIAKLGTELTESQKVQARVGLITQELAKANGNLATTFGGVVAQARAVEGRFENLKDSIGASLMAIAIGPLTDLQTGLQALQMAWESSGFAALNSSIGVVGAAQVQVQSIGWVQKAVGFVADAWYVVRTVFMTVQSYITYGLALLVDGMSGFVKAFDSVAEAFGFAKTGAAKFLDDIADDLMNLSNVQLKGIQDQLTQPWPSDGINAFFDAAKQRTAAMQAQLAATHVDISKFVPKKGPAAAMHAVHQDNKAMGFGSSEAVNTILRSGYGKSLVNKEATRTAENTGQAVQILQRIAHDIAENNSGLVAGF